MIQLEEQIRNKGPPLADDQPASYGERAVNVRDAEKRGRWQGFCFRRTKSGRILPYICWKGCTSYSSNLNPSYTGLFKFSTIFFKFAKVS